MGQVGAPPLNRWADLIQTDESSVWVGPLAIVEPAPGIQSALDVRSDQQSSIVTEFQDTVSHAIQANMRESFSFWLSLLEVKTPTEMFDLSRRQITTRLEAFVAQSRELSTLTQRAALASAKFMTAPFGQRAA